MDQKDIEEIVRAVITAEDDKRKPAWPDILLKIAVGAVFAVLSFICADLIGAVKSNTIANGKLREEIASITVALKTIDKLDERVTFLERHTP